MYLHTRFFILILCPVLNSRKSRFILKFLLRFYIHQWTFPGYSLPQLYTTTSPFQHVFCTICPFIHSTDLYSRQALETHRWLEVKSCNRYVEIKYVLKYISIYLFHTTILTTGWHYWVLTKYQYYSRPLTCSDLFNLPSNSKVSAIFLLRMLTHWEVKQVTQGHATTKLDEVASEFLLSKPFPI